MERDSLEKAATVICVALEHAEINSIDKVELMVNLMHFLNPDTYRTNVEVLSQYYKQDNTLRSR